MEGASLAGSTVAVTGRLASMTHADFEALVGDSGGRFASKPNRATSLLVIGQEGWPLECDGRQTESLLRARRIRAAGYPLRLLTEEEFFRHLGLGDQQDAVRRRCTAAQLSRVLGVPGSRIRCWTRLGLIEPEQVVHRLAFFSFGQVASAKSLCDLVAAGVSPQRIRDNLQQLRRWLPDIETPLAQLTTLEQGGRLLVRLATGELSELNGQLQFDFDEPPPGAQALALHGLSADEWFEEAVRREDLGRLDQACDAYREAIRLEPADPVLHFNLANGLYALGSAVESADHFRRAVECDRGYVEAWNNLGIVLSELSENGEAVAAFQQAVRLVPTYADAHYNLAELLDELGREGEAREHWKFYLRCDPASPAGDEVRHRLAQAIRANSAR